MTVTFLFTDIEGSTQLWERNPEAMKAALACHDELLRRAIEAHQGQLIKTTGDGVLAAFQSALDGLEAVIAGQRLLQAEAWKVADPLKVRMGLHSGEADLRDGDYYGPAVNRAARLMAIGAGGQILISQATADLIAGGLPEGIHLRDLGEHRLKDLTWPEHVYQVAAADLPVEFPPLKSLDAFPNNLPVQLTSFVGREHEMAEVKRLLATTHLLTLTGSGGTGKTRLSLQAAAEVLHGFDAGVWLVELAPIVDPDLVLPGIAATLNVREQPGRTLLDVLIDFLRARSALIILDNCEHLLAACAETASKLLRACPKLKILASSREALGIAGETTYMVPSLSLPDLHSTLTNELLSRSEAARLFIERAQAAIPGFALGEGDARALAELCHRLDGIPLAIELAAARVKILRVSELAARLDDRFRLLTGGSRTALPRQQTLRAMIDWSYDLLLPAERAVLRQLSVFAGGWSLQAAEAVIDVEDLSADVLEMLAQLANKSLVVVEQEQRRKTRYRLLETIRQYAREKLLESGEGELLRDRHLDYFLHAAEANESDRIGPNSIRWLDWCEIEQDNLRAALDWGLSRDPDAALRLVGAVSFAWDRRGQAAESYQALQTALDQVSLLPELVGEVGLARQAARAKALVALGRCYIGRGMNLQARMAFESGAELYEQLNEWGDAAEAIGMLGFTNALLGDIDLANSQLRKAEMAGRQSGRKDVVAMSLGIRGNFLIFNEGEFKEARILSEEAMRIAREIGDPWILAQPLLGKARISAWEGKFEEARNDYIEAIRIFEAHVDVNFIYVAQSELAHLYRKYGYWEKARGLYKQTIRRWQEIGQLAAVAHQLECFAFLAVSDGFPQRAAKLLGAAEALRERLNSKMTVYERIDYDEQIGVLHTLIDEAAFAAAWVAGRNLATDDAILYALDGAAERSV